MSADVAAAQLRFGRLRAQWLTPDGAAAAPVEIVRHLIGIQSQIPSAAVLAVRVRTVHVSAEDVHRDVAPGGPLRVPLGPAETLRVERCTLRPTRTWTGCWPFWRRLCCARAGADMPSWGSTLRR